MVNRREFIAAASSVFLARGGSRPSLLMLSADEAKRLRAAAATTHPILVTLAEEALKAGPWSVTFQRPGAETKAGPNDYFSEGPYWWPDPRNPNGPYVRRDGERNPERFTGNRASLGSMSEAVLALGMGAYLLDKGSCRNHAGEILSVWFAAPKTRMNPNLEYGQAVRGVTAGRGTGIIDTVSLIHAVQGIVLLEAAGGLDPSLANSVRQWFTEYLHWMTTSAKGRDEKMSGNNHATWWTAQVAAYATFVGDDAIQRMAWDHYRDYLVPTEIRPDGSCPREEGRTKSLGYSSMNLDAFATICRLAQIAGVDLWHFKTAKGIGVEKAFNYLMPYVLYPDAWPKQQIERYSADSVTFPGLAGLGLPLQQMLSAYALLPRAKTAWIQFIDLVVRGTGPGLLSSISP